MPDRRMVRLKWNGFPGVPKWLSGDEAEVLEEGRKRLLVQPKSATKPYRVRWDQIIHVKKEQGNE